MTALEDEVNAAEPETLRLALLTLLDLHHEFVFKIETSLDWDTGVETQLAVYDDDGKVVASMHEWSSCGGCDPGGTNPAGWPCTSYKIISTALKEL